MHSLLCSHSIIGQQKHTHVVVITYSEKEAVCSGEGREGQTIGMQVDLLLPRLSSRVNADYFPPLDDVSDSEPLLPCTHQ